MAVSKMNDQNLELEKIKIQKTQMYLQIVSVLLSATLIYFLISEKKSVKKYVDSDISPDLGD